MKRCELCGSQARIYCESDQARLCWDCDLKVHGANFLVARHSRILLCQACQSPTPWSASGARLSPTTVSICDLCSGGFEERESGVADEIDDLDLDDDDDDDDDDYDSDAHFDDEEGEGENQVVPWSSVQQVSPDLCSQENINHHIHRWEDNPALTSSDAVGPCTTEITKRPLKERRKG